MSGGGASDQTSRGAAAGATEPSSAPSPLVAGGRAWLALAVAIGIAWAIHAFVVPYTDTYLTDIAQRVGFNLLAVMGLALVLGFTGQFSLGHAGFMAVGAYAGASLHLATGLPAPLCILLGGAAAAVAGLVVGLPSLRLTGDYLAVVTLGFNGIILVIIQNTPALGGAQGLTGLPRATGFGWTYTFVALGFFFVRNIVASPAGRVLEAVRDNEIATRSLGIDTTRAKVSAFVVGSFWAGVAGALIAFHQTSVFPSQFELLRSIELVAMVVLGGLGSLSGPMLAAAVLTALPEVLRPVAEYRMILYSLLLIIMMLVRPKGLLGTAEVGDLVPWLRKRLGRAA